MEMQGQRYTSFADFYPFYISEHANRTSRRLHVIGTGLVICCAIAALLWNWRLLIALPLIGYGFAWIGHFFFEKNRPATFQYPLYSLMGDFRLFFDVISGKRTF
jgi:hypothetical protein